jgi:SAM-dependent methyltransferase
MPQGEAVPHQDETPEYWSKRTPTELANMVAELHAQRRQGLQKQLNEQIDASRRAVADFVISGSGVEVGAGNRPYPIPSSAICRYGDVLNATDLLSYFKDDVPHQDFYVDAQTFSQLGDESQDFIIMAHVIEHLQNPIGSIENALRALRPGGAMIVVAPNREFTFDRRRPPTTLDHLIADAKDGGASTRMQASIEHIRFIHPELTGETYSEAEILRRAEESMNNPALDLHFHCWNSAEFRAFCDYCARTFAARVEGHTAIVNETIVALRKPISAS